MQGTNFQKLKKNHAFYFQAKKKVFERSLNEEQQNRQIKYLTE